MPSEAEAARASVPRRPLGDSLTAPAGAGTPWAGPRASGGRADTKALSLCHQQRQKHPSELAPPHGELDLTTTRPNPDQTSLRPSDYRHVGLHRILLRSKERPFPTPVSFTGPSAKQAGVPRGRRVSPTGRRPVPPRFSQSGGHSQPLRLPRIPSLTRHIKDPRSRGRSRRRSGAVGAAEQQNNPNARDRDA